MRLGRLVLPCSWLRLTSLIPIVVGVKSSKSPPNLFATTVLWRQGSSSVWRSSAFAGSSRSGSGLALSQAGFALPLPTAASIFLSGLTLETEHLLKNVEPHSVGLDCSYLVARWIQYGFPDVRGRFPDPEINFPDSFLKFPDSLSREFRPKPQRRQRFFGCKRASRGSKSRKFPVFSLMIREFDLESSSHQTASSANLLDAG